VVLSAGCKASASRIRERAYSAKELAIDRPGLVTNTYCQGEDTRGGSGSKVNIDAIQLAFVFWDDLEFCFSVTRDHSTSTSDQCRRLNDL
jgi:hypothetical protein